MEAGFESWLDVTLSELLSLPGARVFMYKMGVPFVSNLYDCWED